MHREEDLREAAEVPKRRYNCISNLNPVPHGDVHFNNPNPKLIENGIKISLT